MTTHLHNLHLPYRSPMQSVYTAARAAAVAEIQAGVTTYERDSAVWHACAEGCTDQDEYESYLDEFAATYIEYATTGTLEELEDED